MVKRADAIMDLVGSLTVAGHVDSPVALSEEDSVSAEIQLHFRHIATWRV